MKTLKAGTYYIGDPCYLFDGSWYKILDETNFFRDDVKIFDKEIFCSSTAYGDGNFFDQYNYGYTVDAGMISCLPIELIDVDKKLSLDDIHHYGRVYTFEKDFSCYEEDGVFYIGNIIINTKGETYYEDDYDEKGYDDSDEEVKMSEEQYKKLKEMKELENKIAQKFEKRFHKLLHNLEDEE